MRENHILIIDDDLMLLKTAEEILSDQYNVSVAKSGIQALNLLNKNIIPDLILLDIDMPQMDGYETLQKKSYLPGLNGIWNDISRDSTNNPWNYQIMLSRSKAS